MTIYKDLGVRLGEDYNWEASWGMVARWGLGLRMWIKLIAHERWQGAGEIWKTGWMHPLSTVSWQQAWIQGRSQEIKVSQIQGAIPNQHRARVWTWGLMRGMGCKSGWWLCSLDIHFCTWSVRKIPYLAPSPPPFFLSFFVEEGYFILLSVSAVQQSGSAIWTHGSLLFWISFPFRILEATSKVSCAIWEVLISHQFYKQ